METLFYRALCLIGPQLLFSTAPMETFFYFAFCLIGVGHATQQQAVAPVAGCHGHCRGSGWLLQWWQRAGVAAAATGGCCSGGVSLQIGMAQCSMVWRNEHIV
uniref:Uncharacterized protein n=1 Tax=Chlamydomonas euryale TaxID=1486919 RepID=A0A7R9VCZ6_9CHLO|mmetsp:Transcript_30107/g.89297  ORF Transcript_30107/g.89297 Transcript_30107/m.89297 type:complete len:103 (+) Transcript_30107:544-852(+)